MAIPQVQEKPTETNTTKPSTSSSPTETKEEKQEAKQEQKIKTKENETVVPGFGIAIDFALIEQPQGYYQEQLTNLLDLEQEQNYAREQNLLLDLISPNGIGLNLNDSANNRWRSLLHDNPLQSDAFGD